MDEREQGANKSAATAAMEQVVVMALERMTDAQLVGFTAQQMRGAGGTLAGYIAQRLDLISVGLEANDAGRRA